MAIVFLLKFILIKCGLIQFFSISLWRLNNMRIFYQIIFVFSLFALMSCEEDFLFDTGHFVPKVTVNCIFKPDSPWEVQLSYSKSAFEGDGDINMIQNAEVYIYELRNGREIYLKHQGDGLYTSDIYPPKQNSDYELVIHLEGYEKITAKSGIPRKANVVYVTQNIVERTVEFQIQNEESNFYLWNFMNGTTLGQLNNGRQSPSEFVKGIVTYNNASDFIANITSGNNEAVGTGGIFSAGINNAEGDENLLGANQDSTITKKFLRMLTASEDFFKFYKDYERYFANSGFHSSVSNPPGQFSNVNNGIGIFAGYTEEFKEID